MYQISKFAGHQMMATSVPPDAHVDLPEAFAELSHIHFYLGQAPIDHMVKAVEEASLETIAKGKLQIYFAAKEIQEFFSYSGKNLDIFHKNSESPSFYFQQTFDEILNHAQEVLENTYKNPNKKKNFIIVETMMGLTHEVGFLSQELLKVGIPTDVGKIDEIEHLFSKIYDLKSHYDVLSSLKKFDAYAACAKQSVMQQLAFPYQFNYSELAQRVYINRDDWMPTWRHLVEQRAKMNEPDYVLDVRSMQNLKDEFFKQLKSFNFLLSNGVISYVHSFSASISREVYNITEKTLLSADAYFERTKTYHEDAIKRSFISADFHKEELKNLNATKHEYIQQKISDKDFYAKYLTLLYRQETNISHTLDKIKVNLFNTPVKDTVTFQGDIAKGFVIGTFSNSDKLLLVHKECGDQALLHEIPQAIFAVAIEKSKYDELVEKDALIFNREFKEHDFISASSFWSYGQFLQEISDPYVQKFFLGQEFNLIDNTVLKIKEKA